jgi:hypothetical protein
MSNQTVAEMFVLLLGRSATTGEFNTYSSQTRNAIASILVNSPEGQQRYGGLTHYRIVQIIYGQSFARQPVLGEINFWSKHLQNNNSNIAATALTILDSAAGNDLIEFNSKVTTALNNPHTGSVGLKTPTPAPILTLPPCKWEVSLEKTVYKTSGKLGDGYSLAAIAPNSDRLVYTLSIPGLRTSERNSIVSTLKSYKSTTKFRWRPIEFMPYKEYICDKFSTVNEGDNVWTLNATFTEQR